MLILGFNGGVKFAHEEAPGYRGHDSSAVLMRDGEVLAAIEEERLIRLKHTNCFPEHAIRWCLDTAGADWPDIDRLATNMSRGPCERLAQLEFWTDATRGPLRDAPTRLADLFDRAFNVDVTDRLRFCHHHLAHAWSAFVPSGFDRSLILSIDGAGDDTSGMVLLGRDREITRLRDYTLPQSLGHFYLELIRLLGYSRFDEYKVMGLAPYGDPAVYTPLMAQLHTLLPEGDYRLASRPELVQYLHTAGLLADARRRGQPFSQMHIDFAAALQACLESIVFHIVTHFRERTNERNLCLAGGVAHNCTLNGTLLYSGLFDHVFVQPAAHDAGGSLGAAWWAYHNECRSARRPASFRHLYFGADVGDADTIETELQRWHDWLSFERVDDVTAHAARLLADGAVIAWTQGRCEFGPRALGNRSILADPRPAANKQIINDLVKKREAYRPFAPSVLLERARTYFDLPADQDELPFMIFVVKVREPWRAQLGAITHVDGTARIQTVARDVNPRFWTLIREFERLTGIGVVLNTSFNNNAEPIVSSARDAIVCFLTTAIEYLVVGDFVVRKKPLDKPTAICASLVPDLPVHRKLVRKKRADAAGYRMQIDSVKSQDFGPTDVEISPELFNVLQRTDGVTPLGALLESASVRDDTMIARVCDECHDLWSRRILVMRPVD